jgi:glutathionylspermidine synthase
MKRESISPRANWRERAEELGFEFHTIGDAYWDESACYRFTVREIDALDDATAELNRLCQAAVKQVVEKDRNKEVGIPDQFWPWVKASYHRGDPSIYGRFDLAYDGKAIKLLEFNADTPTALFEASVVQWQWLEDTRPDADQFNSIHEKLIARWPEMERGKVHFACQETESGEDEITVAYLADTAEQAGIETEFLQIEEIGRTDAGFVDANDQPIGTLFKLYPWEFAFQDEFGAHLSAHPGRFIEPPWRSILSNKGILAVLWDMEPGHPLLLEASLDPLRFGSRPHVKKPLHGREGANIGVVERSATSSTDGPYSGEPFVFQALAAIPDFDGNSPVLGSWVIGDSTAGIGIREDRNRITTNGSRFIPHYFMED